MANEYYNSEASDETHDMHSEVMRLYYVSGGAYSDHEVSQAAIEKAGWVGVLAGADHIQHMSRANVTWRKP